MDQSEIAHCAARGFGALGVRSLHALVALGQIAAIEHPGNRLGGPGKRLAEAIGREGCGEGRSRTRAIAADGGGRAPIGAGARRSQVRKEEREHALPAQAGQQGAQVIGKRELCAVHRAIQSVAGPRWRGH